MQDNDNNEIENKTSDSEKETLFTLDDTAEDESVSLQQTKRADVSPQRSSLRTKSSSAKRKKRTKILSIILISLLSFVLILVGVAVGLFKYYYGMLDYNDGKEWESVEIDEETDDLGDIDSDLMASEDEKDKFLGQVESVGSGNFEVDVKKLGGSLGTIERDYACEYISYKDDVINILLIGLDSRANVNVGLSDVMMVVSICPSEKKIVLTSFLRDVYVMIPGYGGNRLNVAYSIGGPALLIETIEKNFGLRIDRYATSNFFAFVDVADYIGKVKVYLTEAEVEALKTHIVWTNSVLFKGHPYSYYRQINTIEDKGAGYYELNGVQALAYARIRNLDSDFGRTNRQRVIMAALFNEVKKMSPMQWNKVLERILPVITTNLSESDILKIMLNIGAYVKYDIEMYSMPPADNFKYMIIDGRAVIGVDQNYVKAYLKKNIYAEE